MFKNGLIIAIMMLQIFFFAVSCIGAEREEIVGDYYEEGGNFFSGSVVPEPGQDVFIFGDLPWEMMGISETSRIPQWIGYGPSRWTFMTAPSNQMLLQGKLTDSGLTMLDLMANLIFEISKMAVLTGNVIVLATYQNYVADFLPDLISGSIGALYGNGLLAGAEGGNYPMWQFAVGLAVVGLGFTVALHFFRARMVQGLMNYAMAALILSLLLVYFAQADNIAAWTNDAMDKGTALVVVGTFNALMSQQDGPPAHEAFNDTLLRITETTWDLFIGRPWALGQWGTYDIEGRDQASLWLSENEVSELQKNTYEDVLGTLWSDISGANTAAARPIEIPDNSNYIDKVYLGGNESTRSKLLEIVQNRNSIVHTACGEEWMSATRHVEYALLSLFPAIGYVALTISIGLPVFAAQVMMGILLILFPLALIIGISGDSGRRMLISFSRVALNLFLTKIVYGLYLAMILAVISILWKVFTSSYAILMICTCTMMGYALKQRHAVMELVLAALSGANSVSGETAKTMPFMHRAGMIAAGSTILGRLPIGINKKAHPGNNYYVEPPYRSRVVQMLKQHERQAADSARRPDRSGYCHEDETGGRL